MFARAVLNYSKHQCFSTVCTVGSGLKSKGAYDVQHKNEPSQIVKCV